MTNFLKQKFLKQIFQQQNFPVTILKFDGDSTVLLYYTIQT